MGKRNRKSRPAPVADPEPGMPKTVRKETMDIVNILLEKCSNPVAQKGKEWDEYVELHGLVETLRKKQANWVMSHPDRVEGFPAFMAWLEQGGATTENIAIGKFDVGGYGLKATADIKESDLFLSVPYKLMMTNLTAKVSVLGPLIKGDRMLQAMPNVALSLHVMCERASGESPWAPYLNILPHSYNTPLYFTVDEMSYLKGSPALVEALNQYKNIARQYSYFFKQFQALDDILKLPIRHMCYDDYRWAVSTVMTRQNQIPNRRGEQNVISLIPLWDMCNHDNGHITTDYDMKTDCSKCYALRTFNKDDQIFIFYGERSNADLLVHNGFIFPENQSDKLNIKLGISKNDHLFAMKSEVLARLSMNPSRVFGLLCGPDPVDSSLAAYLRVFNMDQVALEARLVGDKAKKLRHELKDFGLLVSVENEMKCWNFLETRVKLLLKTYPSTQEEDERLLSSATVSERGRAALQLRVSERRILETTAEFSRLQRREVEGLVRQRLEEMSLGMGDLETGADSDDDDLAGLSVRHTGPTITELEDDEPAETSVKPADVAAKPADVTAKPADVAAKPADVAAKPADVTAKPADVTAKPADVTAKPADVTAKPADEAAKPADAAAKPADVAAKPADAVVKATDTAVKAADTEVKPADTTVAPADASVTQVAETPVPTESPAQ